MFACSSLCHNARTHTSPRQLVLAQGVSSRAMSYSAQPYLGYLFGAILC